VTKKTEPFNNPFSQLKGLSKQSEPKGRAPPPPPPPAPKRRPASRRDDEEDAALFLEAVGEVAPVRVQKARAPAPPPPTAGQLRVPTEEAESLARLAELVSPEGTFDITDKEATIEAAVQGFDARVMKKLRAGEFSAQARVDLHGLNREEARDALERFIQASRVAGHRCVLIVTGRGLHSKDQIPVLKQGVQTWLTRGRSARQVLAFCTARPADGGSGAVYVLLRR